jgi:hypothetical protein
VVLGANRRRASVARQHVLGLHFYGATSDRSLIVLTVPGAFPPQQRLRLGKPPSDRARVGIKSPNFCYIITLDELWEKSTMLRILPVLMCLGTICGTAIAQTPTSLPAPVTGPWTSGSPGNGSSACPQGHHVVGINVQGSANSVKYCIGCVAKLQVVCLPDR